MHAPTSLHTNEALRRPCAAVTGAATGVRGRSIGAVMLDIVSITGESRGSRQDLYPFPVPGSMLLEPLQCRQAECVIGEIAQHQPMPGASFVGTAHLLSQVGQALV
jgi:hypothetical protein